ncbi:unnamed protein product [Amoebophrya sp. A25]|nr:unnamed protein product [Amoebophrya sp. A25]|eukprot:GSA25T00021855001.1
MSQNMPRQSRRARLCQGARFAFAASQLASLSYAESSRLGSNGELLPSDPNSSVDERQAKGDALSTSSYALSTSLSAKTKSSTQTSSLLQNGRRRTTEDDEDAPKTTSVRFERTRDDRKKVQIGVGDSLTVALWGNPIFGKRWRLARESECMLQTGKMNFRQDAVQEPILGGDWKWTFEAQHCCESALSFVYELQDEDSTKAATSVSKDDLSGGIPSSTTSTSSVHVTVDVDVVPSPMSMKHGDGCTLPQPKTSGVNDEDSWFV